MNLIVKGFEKEIWAKCFINSIRWVSNFKRIFPNPAILILFFGLNMYSKSGDGNAKFEVIPNGKISSCLIIALPVVSEPNITSIGRDSIHIEGNIITDGGTLVTERGIIYNIISKGNEETQKVISGSGTGTFSILLNRLPKNMVFLVKAYAINNEGIGYSPEKQFDTFELPRFTTLLKPEVNYDNEYFSSIKTEPVMGQLTKFSAISKPEWLTISTDPVSRIYAGDVRAGFSNGMKGKSLFSAPYALTSNSMGTIFVADQVDNRIRKISPEGEVSTIAGIASSGFKDGLGIEARFNTPSGIAVDPQGFIYVSDQNNHSIRKISPSGEVITFAGSQKAGAENGRGAEARFKYPAGICIDARGFIYVADRGNHLIRVISPEGLVSTLAGSGELGFADGNGGMAKFNAPTGIAVDNSGFIYVADQVNNRIRKISPAGVVSTVAGNGQFSNRDGTANQAAFRYPTALVFDSDENLYVADQLNHSVRKISRSGNVSTIKLSSETDLKSGGGASILKNPSGICFNKDGNIVLADYHNHNIKEITRNTTLYGTPSKSQLGSHNIVIKASNAFGSTVQESKLIVKDNISPEIVSTTPVNMSEGVDRTFNMQITFDEEISLTNSGSIRIHQGDEILRKYYISEAANSKEIILSEDKNSLILAVKDLPAASLLSVDIDGGIVQDISKNLFEKETSKISSWSFTTKPKQKQTLELMPLPEMTFGDRIFKLGPLHTSKGLPITYFAEDPKLLFISGDSAQVLNSGKTTVIAVHNGDDDHLPVRVERTLMILPMTVIIKPHLAQKMTYGNTEPEIKFDIISGRLVNEDKFSGGLAKAKGDTIGVYSISIGSLSFSNNYRIKLEAGTISLQKATLLVKANDQTKIAGTPNPEFTCTYEGFVNAESPANLLNLPQLSCVSKTGSFIGSYPINISDAGAKNYNIVYQSGTLNILPTGEAEFDVAYLTLLENMPSGTRVALLKKKKQSSQPLILNFVKGDGDTDNNLFKISGSSIVTTIPLDYEERQQYSIRVKSDWAFGESFEKQLNLIITNVNEKPQMMKIPLEEICLEGIIQLNGITAGPENDQTVKIFVKAIGSGSKSYFEVSQPVNGTSQLKYSIANKLLKDVNFQIILKDNGGILYGGIDSAVYNYTFKVTPYTPVKIISEKGLTLLRGTSSFLSAKGKGEFQWYFNKQILKGEQSDFLKINAPETGIYSVKLTSDEGCISEGRINISVADIITVTCTNLITPNSDGINDSFIARNIEHFPGNELWIMDRTGKLVYNQKCYSNDWQGTFNGSILPNGTYYFLLDLGNKKERLMGYISVLNAQ